METYINIAYLVAAVCFIYGLKMLSHPKTARNGNMIASVGMLIAIIVTFLSIGNFSTGFIYVLVLLLIVFLLLL